MKSRSLLDSRASVWTRRHDSPRGATLTLSPVGRGEGTELTAVNSGSARPGQLCYRPDVHRIFLLSPAQSGGKRAQLLFNPKARFSLAHRLQHGEGVALGEIFSFLSGLYFRGKLAYAR